MGVAATGSAEVLIADLEAAGADGTVGVIGAGQKADISPTLKAVAAVVGGVAFAAEFARGQGAVVIIGIRADIADVVAMGIGAYIGLLKLLKIQGACGAQA